MQNVISIAELKSVARLYSIIPNAFRNTQRYIMSKTIES